MFGYSEDLVEDISLNLRVGLKRYSRIHQHRNGDLWELHEKLWELSKQILPILIYILYVSILCMKVTIFLTFTEHTSKALLSSTLLYLLISRFPRVRRCCRAHMFTLARVPAWLAHFPVSLYWSLASPSSPRRRPD